MSITALLLVISQRQLIESRIFEGGSQRQYVAFLQQGGTRLAGSVQEARIGAGFSPTRLLKYSDGSFQLVPPLPPVIEAVTQGLYPIFRSQHLPENYLKFRKLLSEPRDDADKADKKTFREKEGVHYRVSGEMRLGNGLPLLGFPVDIHPFFDDFWVDVDTGDLTDSRILEVVALTVGGRLVMPTTADGRYRIEPDAEDIRSRALKTLEYYASRSSIEYVNMRSDVVQSMIQAMTRDQFAAWIDCSKKPIRLQAEQFGVYKDIKAYRDAYLKRMETVAPKVFTPEGLDVIRSQPIEVEFGPKLTLNFYTTLPNGKALLF